MTTLQEYFDSQLQIVFIRLTIDKNLETVFNDIKSYKSIIKIIVAKELSKSDKLHYHVLIMTNDDNQKNAQQNIKNHIKKLYDINGNKDFANTEVNIKKGTIKRLATYCVKDGEFLQEGFKEEQIQLFRKLSYKKFNGKEIVEEFEKLKEEYLTKEFNHPHDDVKFLYQRLFEIKRSYNQQYTITTIKPKVNLLYGIKHGDSELADYAAQNHWR